jgi:hypothetical protein
MLNLRKNHLSTQFRAAQNDSSECPGVSVLSQAFANATYLTSKAIPVRNVAAVAHNYNFG